MEVAVVVVACWVVSSSAVVCLERLLFRVTCCVLCETLNPMHLLLSLGRFELYRDFVVAV